MANEGCTHRDSPQTRFALGYLRAQSKGFARGYIIWATLRAAIDKAVASGASADEIAIAVVEGEKDATDSDGQWEVGGRNN